MRKNFVCVGESLKVFIFCKYYEEKVRASQYVSVCEFYFVLLRVFVLIELFVFG